MHQSPQSGDSATVLYYSEPAPRLEICEARNSTACFTEFNSAFNSYGSMPSAAIRARTMVSANISSIDGSRHSGIATRYGVNRRRCPAHRPAALFTSVGGEIKSKDTFVIVRPFQYFGVPQRAARIMVAGAPMLLHAEA
jgi:hypothetical protein